MKLRIARATNDLLTISKMYQKGLDFEVLASFKDHAGFDGIMLGKESLSYHLEFTQQHGVEAPRSHSQESLLVFYLPNNAEFEVLEDKMRSSGFKQVVAHNPYWDQNGITFEDAEGYRIVLCRNEWK